MIEDIEWDSFIVIKTQEINLLKQEITELEMHLNKLSPRKLTTISKTSSSPISDTFHKPIKDIFYRYATVFSYNEIYLDLSHFKLIFTELGLGGKDLPWKQAELVFHSVSKRSNIDFDKFLKILKKICFLRFKSHTLHNILPLFKIPEKRIDLIDKSILTWIEEASSGRVKEVISGYEELLRIIYVVYGSKDVKHQNKMVLINLLEFCVDCKIIPSVVSKLEVSRVFRAVDYDECLGYEDFLVVFAVVSILGMGKIGISEPVEAVNKMLSIISENSEFIYTKKNQNCRWNGPG